MRGALIEEFGPRGLSSLPLGPPPTRGRGPTLPHPSQAAAAGRLSNSTLAIEQATASSKNKLDPEEIALAIEWPAAVPCRGAHCNSCLPDTSILTGTTTLR
jgi:hypothetical protein